MCIRDRLISVREGQPAIARITDVQSDRFTMYLQEPSNLGGAHDWERVSYALFEAGYGNCPTAAS